MTNSPETDTRPVLLEVRDIVVHYGRIRALHGVSLKVHEGELVTLLGSNGAGKTTMMRAISGLLPLTSGSILFDGRDIGKVKAHRRVADGLIQAPEGRGVFPNLTVTENLRMATYAGTSLKTVLDRAFTRFPRLAERRKQLAGTLSGGEQQMLAIGRALMARPRILLLDEPSMGLAPILVDLIFEEIVYLNKERNTTILLVEQNALMALEVAHRGYVLQTGQIINGGDSKTLRNDPKVIAAYLGG